MLYNFISGTKTICRLIIEFIFDKFQVEIFFHKIFVRFPFLRINYTHIIVGNSIPKVVYLFLNTYGLF